MSKSPQRRAIETYRARLGQRGMARFEVIGRDEDRDLVRSVARSLAEGGAQADRLRAAIDRSLRGDPPARGGVVKSLLASPLIGSELDLSRPHEEGRPLDL